MTILYTLLNAFGFNIILPLFAIILKIMGVM